MTLIFKNGSTSAWVFELDEENHQVSCTLETADAVYTATAELTEEE